MSRGDSQTPSASRIKASALAKAWSCVLALGVVATLPLTAACGVALPSREADGLSGNLGRLLLVAAAGLVCSMVAATVVTVRARRLMKEGRSVTVLWRRVRVAGAVVALCGPVLWLAANAADHRRYRRVTESIVGTWHIGSSAGRPFSEVTFHPDGTCDHLPLTGLNHERVKRRGGYEISPDGLSINIYDLPKPSRRLPDGTPIWDSRIEFHGPDHFRVWWMSWHTRGGYSYRRVS